jgi:hypothetical protein
MRLAAAITTPVTNAAMQVNSSISLRTRAMATPQRLERGQEYPHTREPNSEPHYWFHKVPTGRAPESLPRPSKPFHISPLGVVATGDRFRASRACDEENVLRAICPVPGSTTRRQSNGRPRLAARAVAELRLAARCVSLERVDGGA